MTSFAFKSLLAAALLVSGSQANDPTTIQPLNTTTTARTLKSVCIQPGHAVDLWYYAHSEWGPYTCTKEGDDHGKWSMLRAYRSRGTRNQHWIYTKNENDSRCLENWTYYAKNGKTVYGHVTGRTTFLRDKKRWCATNVYQPGGIEGKQWAYCSCT